MVLLFAPTVQCSWTMDIDSEATFSCPLLINEENTELILHPKETNQDGSKKVMHRPQHLHSLPCTMYRLHTRGAHNALNLSLSAPLPFCQSLATHDRCDSERRGATQRLCFGKYNWMTSGNRITEEWNSRLDILHHFWIYCLYYSLPIFLIKSQIKVLHFD